MHYRYVPRGGGGGTLIFSYIRKLSPFRGRGQNFEFQHFSGFQKNKYYLGYEHNEDIVDIYLGITKLDNFCGSISIHVRTFS